MKLRGMFFLTFFFALNWCETEAQFQLEPAFSNLSFIRPADLQHAGDGSNHPLPGMRPNRPSLSPILSGSVATGNGVLLPTSTSGSPATRSSPDRERDGWPVTGKRPPGIGCG